MCCCLLVASRAYCVGAFLCFERIKIPQKEQQEAELDCGVLFCSVRDQLVVATKGTWKLGSFFLSSKVSCHSQSRPVSRKKKKTEQKTSEKGSAGKCAFSVDRVCVTVCAVKNKKLVCSSSSCQILTDKESNRKSAQGNQAGCGE